MNSDLLDTIWAMIGGVFYWEFTKSNSFTAKTTLSVIHTHYFLLGMVFFLLLLVLKKNLSFTGAKTGRVLVVHHIGLNLTAVILAVCGMSQVMGLISPEARARPSLIWLGSDTPRWASVLCFCCWRSSVACRLLSPELHNKIQRGTDTTRGISPLFIFPSIHAPPSPRSIHNTSPPYAGSPRPLWRWHSDLSP